MKDIVAFIRGVVDDKGSQGVVDDICIPKGIYKPHLYLAIEKVQREGLDELTTSQLASLLSLDQVFFKYNFKGKPINTDRILREIVELNKHEWFVRIPEWLNTAVLQLTASQEYCHKVVMSVRTPYFDKDSDDIPSMTTAISHIQPSTWSTVDIMTVFGPQQVKLKLIPALSYVNFITMFKEIAALKCLVTETPIASLGLTLSNADKDFLESGKLPQSPAAIRELTVLATSTTPYSAMLTYILKRVSDLDSVVSEALISYRSQMMDKDVKIGAMCLGSGKLMLTSRQIQNTINKLRLKYPILLDGTTSKDLFYSDYAVWDQLRYVSDDPAEAAFKMHQATDYCNTVAKRIKAAKSSKVKAKPKAKAQTVKKSKTA